MKVIPHTVRATLLAMCAMFCVVSFLQPAKASASSYRWTCADFGTRERAQYEFGQNRLRLSSLDGDRDGQACEENTSTSWFLIPFGFAGSIFGIRTARSGKYKMKYPSGIRGLTHYYFEPRYPEGDLTRIEVYDEKAINLSIGVGVLCWLIGRWLQMQVLDTETGPLELFAYTAGVGAAIAYVVGVTNKNYAP